MNIVELKKDSPLDLLTEAINDINESGEIPDQCIIICGGMRYQIGYSTDDEIAGALSKEAIAIMMTDLFSEYFEEE